MADSITIEVSDADKAHVNAVLKTRIHKIIDGVGPVLMEAGQLVETACKQECPVAKVNGGTLRSSIHTEQVSKDEVHVAPHTFYAAWVEFGHHSWSGDPYMKRGVEKSRQHVAAYIKSALGK